MDANHVIDVTGLDNVHRRALEDVIGIPLQANQRLIIRVTEAEAAKPPGKLRPAQTLDDLPNIYEGLADAQIEAIERDINTRANLTRNLP